MKPQILFIGTKDGKVEMPQEEFKKLLDDNYNAGFNDGAQWQKDLAGIPVPSLMYPYPWSINICGTAPKEQPQSNSRVTSAKAAEYTASNGDIYRFRALDDQDYDTKAE